MQSIFVSVSVIEGSIPFVF